MDVKKPTWTSKSTPEGLLITVKHQGKELTRLVKKDSLSAKTSSGAASLEVYQVYLALRDMEKGK